MNKIGFAIAGVVIAAGLIVNICYFGEAKLMNSKSVTELVVSTFNYPHPYRLNYVAEYRFVHQVGEFLVRRDNYQNIIGGLAQSWTISENRKSIIFHLRPNLYTAVEVAQSLRRLILAKQTSHSNLAHQISSPDDIEVVDHLNLKITTSGDAGAILAPLVMADTVIVPDSHWIHQNHGSEPQVDWTQTKGPYIYESGDFRDLTNRPIVFRPNPNHYFYSSEQLKWKIRTLPISGIENLEQLKKYLDQEPSFTTIRYWELLNLFFTKDPGLEFYETKTNGINFLIPNLKSSLFKSKAARLQLLRSIFGSEISLLNSKNRADQIPQPGLVGRLSAAEREEVLGKIMNSPTIELGAPIRWLIPEAPEANKKWVAEVAKASGLEYKLEAGPFLKFDQKWNSGEIDVMHWSIGMSDTDPISGASFLFSPAALGLDSPDGRILKMLNAAKDTFNRDEITKAVRLAFRTALEEGLIIPINYVTNRHYYSSGVELNIQDPYSESIRIWEVRLKD